MDVYHTVDRREFAVCRQQTRLIDSKSVVSSQFKSVYSLYSYMAFKSAPIVQCVWPFSQVAHQIYGKQCRWPSIRIDGMTAWHPCDIPVPIAWSHFQLNKCFCCRIAMHTPNLRHFFGQNIRCLCAVNHRTDWCTWISSDL